MASVQTRGRTRQKSSPVAGRTAAKMEAEAKRLSHKPGGRSPRIHQRCVVRPCLTHAGLVHEPKRDLLVSMGFGGGRYGVAKPLWAKASAARPFRFG